MTKLLPYRINWSNPLEESFSYKTEVIASRDKTEQRIAWRSQPRLSLSFVASPMRAQVKALWDTLRQDMAERTVVPNETAPARLSVAAPAGTITLTLVGALPVWAAAGKFLVVRTTAGAELHQIASVAGSVVTLNGVLDGALASGAAVYQGFTGALDQGMRAKLLTTRAANLNVEFSVDPGDNLFFADDDPTFPDMLGDLPLLLIKPNWAESIDLSAMGFLETTDFGFGKVEHNIDSFLDYSDVAHKGGYSLFDRPAIEKMKAFFHKVKGQQKPFMVPSWVDSTIYLTDGVTAGDTTVYAQGTELYDTLQAGTGLYGGTITFYPNGSYQVNTVASYSTRLSNYGNLPGFCVYRGTETTSDGLIGTLTEHLILPREELPNWDVGDRITMVSVTNNDGFQSGEITVIDPFYGIDGMALVSVAVDDYSGTQVTDSLWIIAPEDAVGPGGTSGYETWAEYILDAPRETVVEFDSGFDYDVPVGDSATQTLLLIKARFIVDTLTLNYQTATVATTQLTYKPMKEAME